MATVINLFEWLVKLLSKEIFPSKKYPRCGVCSLRASYVMNIEIVELDTDNLQQIEIKICRGCNEEINERYSSE